MNRWKQAGIATMVAVSALAAGGAGAGATTPPSEPTPSSTPASTDVSTVGPRMQAICARAPRLLARTERIVDRLEGDADTRGSLAWLQAHIDTAQADANDNVVTVLTNRLHVREAQLQLLKDRKDLLQQLVDACQERAA